MRFRVLRKVLHCLALLMLTTRAASAAPTTKAGPHVAGEIVIALRANFPACAHCMVAEGRALRSVTGTSVLDRLFTRYHVTTLDAPFGHGRLRRRAVVQGPAAALTQIYVAHVDPGIDVRSAADDFRRDPNVVWAEPNYLYRAASAEPKRLGGGAGMIVDELPDDPYLHSSGSWGQLFPDLWGLFRIEAPEAWKSSTGEGVVVAVVDTGVDATHEDLAENIWRNPGEIPGNNIDDDGNGLVDDVEGWDFTRCVESGADGCVTAKSPGPDVRDDYGHGTHVAGIIAAVGNNGTGIIGVAPKAQIMVLKGLDKTGVGSATDLAQAIVYAAEEGAEVINTSWAGNPAAIIKAAVEHAESLGALVVAAAGNSAAPLEQGIYPASLSQVIAVGATNHFDAPAPFSNFGGPLDLVAPGGGDTEPVSAQQPALSILSLLSAGATLGQVCKDECQPIPGGDDCDLVQVCEAAPWVVNAKYLRLAGTSQAAPYVSGVAALVRSRHPELTVGQVRQVLRQSADDLGPPGWDKTFGYGRVNARRAVEIADIPVVEITAPRNSEKLWEVQFPYAVRGSIVAPHVPVRSWRLTLSTGLGEPQVLNTGSGPTGDAVLAVLRIEQGLERGRMYELRLEAEDNEGRIAYDTSQFLIPDLLFAPIPVPNPYGGSAKDVSLSADGSRLAFTRGDASTASNDAVYVFDTRTRQLQLIAFGGGSHLSGDGRFLAYEGRLPDSTLCNVNLPGSTIRYAVDRGEAQCLPVGTSSGPLSADGERMAFRSTYQLDPSVPDSDGTYEAFFLDIPSGGIRQVTRALSGSAGDGVEFLSLSNDGSRLAFASQLPFDPNGTVNNKYQVFLYDDSVPELRQLTNHLPQFDGGISPSLSGDGGMLAYLADAVFIVDVASGNVRPLVSGLAGRMSRAILTANGRTVLFEAIADLDPRVRNEDLGPEVFSMDVSTGGVTQLTDTVRNVYGLELQAVDGTGGSSVIGTSSEINGLGLHPLLTRMIRRRRPNRTPVLDAPATTLVSAEQPMRVTFRATDPDGDPLTLYAELADRPLSQLHAFASAVFSDHGDGTADLTITPRVNDEGTYTLRVAAFDEAGGVTVQDVQLVVHAMVVEGDVNCDGRVDLADLRDVIPLLFGDAPLMCNTADGNGDGRITAADIVMLLRRIAL